MNCGYKRRVEYIVNQIYERRENRVGLYKRQKVY